MHATDPARPPAPATPGMEHLASGTCASCGTPLAGEWCHACGERRRNPDDLRVRAFVAQAAAGALDLDGRLARTFYHVVMRPGLLTKEWVAGRRVRWLAPVQLFLLVNLIFFAGQGVIGGQETFTTRLQYHLTMPGYGPVARSMVNRVAPEGTASRAEYGKRFEEATPRYANSMVILMVPLYALALAVLSFRRRAPFVQHLVLSLHFMTFLLVFTMSIPLLLAPIAVLLPGLTAGIGEAEVTILFIAVMAMWLGAAFRRLYRGSWPVSVTLGVLAAFLLMPVLIAYRMVLFFAVHWAVT